MSSSEPAKRKKVDASSRPSTGATDGDHRKRRRNRTTQSCLNCHTSKRMCDRKRPCGRCTQLGITGLCVYEVDDPSQRAEAADDKTRLQKRVAELEGVIRELKNKPHPRWTQPLSDVHHGQLSHASSESAPSPLPIEHSSSTPQDEMSDIDTPSPSPKVDNTTGAPLSVPKKRASRLGSLVLPSFEELPGQRSPSVMGPFSVASSSSNSSPLATPDIDDTAIPSLSAFGPISPGDDPMASLFSYFTDGGAHSSAPFVELFDSTLCDMTSDKPAPGACLSQHSGHQTPNSECGCLLESANYHAVLELSLRLRHAAEVLNQHPLHSKGSLCLLKQRIAELDAYTSNTLGNVDTPGMRRYLQTRTTHPRHNPPPGCASPDACWAAGSTVFAAPAAAGVSPRTLMRPSDDSLMSWAPQRHRNVSMSSAPIPWGSAGSSRVNLDIVSCCSPLKLYSQHLP
ncbi:hypothetical protein B0F90DRAFT_1720780 [Multifurca ochricompacta]|uniref:Zn(2)-C6 fungal-type domain-containing protein n=1 Tax=Multifurca ochricompacta TaxID=376703 RepID=A0AAD4QNK5_9AGAM|nr:hypothetical protein B0F90DRAFT_1720780 [Multifurca ochricompacta]